MRAVPDWVLRRVGRLLSAAKGRWAALEEAILDIIFVLAGLAGLFAGGEALVRGAVAIAQRLSLPPLLIGLTVVGFGTSMPELLVSLQAALKGAPDIAIGNIVGSNIANILLILGITALVWPIRVAGGGLKRDLAVMLAAALALIPFFVGGQIGRGAGLALFAGLALYLLWAFLSPGDVAEDSAPPSGAAGDRCSGWRWGWRCCWSGRGCWSMGPAISRASSACPRRSSG